MMEEFTVDTFMSLLPKLIIEIGTTTFYNNDIKVEHPIKDNEIQPYVTFFVEMVDIKDIATYNDLAEFFKKNAKTDSDPVSTNTSYKLNADNKYKLDLLASRTIYTDDLNKGLATIKDLHSKGFKFTPSVPLAKYAPKEYFIEETFKHVAGCVITVKCDITSKLYQDLLKRYFFDMYRPSTSSLSTGYSDNYYVGCSTVAIGSSSARTTIGHT